MKGFTLIEMMVALFIFGLISAAGIGVMRFSMDNQERVRAATSRVAELQTARALLKADLSQASMRRVRGPDGRPAGRAFLGNEQASGGPLLALVRRGVDNPDATPRPSLQYVEYRLSGDTLERRVREGLDGGGFLPPRPLLSGVRKAQLRFLWHGQWLDTLPLGTHADLPQAVRLDLDLAGFGPVSQWLLVTGASS
jgi:general secretion pathway protein J